MGKRGRWTLIVPLAAALSISLAGTGCQVLDGPDEESSAGYHPGAAGSNDSRFPTGTPSRGESSGVTQTSHTTPAGELPPPAPPPGAAGCGAGVVLGPAQEAGPIPTELAKASFPAYKVGPPDILILDTVRLLPRPPYRIEPLDVVTIVVTGTLEKQPIAGKFVVTPDGTINLGFGYGAVAVAGKTLQQAEAAIQAHLGRVLRNAQVAVSLDQMRVLQQVRGTHLVRPDGTLGLGSYGCIYVAGLTLSQVKCEIERHLSRWFLEPQVSVDVFAYNSKFYYVIFDGGGYGQQVLKLPATGTETVLDAIASVGGLPAVASKKYIWVARPAPCGYGCDQLLPVDWNAITQGGSTCTNYQLFPGDRVFVKADCLIATDNWIAKIVSPVERVFGVTLLGASTVQTIRFNNNNNNGTGTGFVAVP
jgi:protein involved in polysaccharide export with SLBB domain